MKKSVLLFPFLFIIFNCKVNAQKPPYKPLRITAPIILDGKLLEPEWSNVETESEFLQSDPVAGEKPSLQTDVMILYDNNYLYAAIRCHDNEPKKIIQTSFERDFAPDQDDGTAFVIDSYNDKNTGIAFISNTLGARFDTEISGNGFNDNASFNTFWDVQSHVDSAGYTTEYRIPFSSLRFQSHAIVTMGFKVIRLIKRKNEFMICPAFDKEIDDPYFKVSLCREMIFENLESKKPVYVAPYIIANYNEAQELNEEETAYERQTEFMAGKNYFSDETLDRILSNMGLDVKYGITKNFTLDLTLNTDFAQAEVDNRIINLSKYEIELPEKRSFFLESGNYLKFSAGEGHQMFFSRNIGIEDETLVPIIGGARVTGKVSGFAIGALNMQTTELSGEGIPSRNYSVFRTRKDLDERGSFAGGIFTNRSNTSMNSESNQTFGLDIVKRFDEKLFATISIAGTPGNGDFSHIGETMLYNFFGGYLANEDFSGTLGVDIVKEEFDPVMGFSIENDYGSVYGETFFKWVADEEEETGEEKKVSEIFAGTAGSYRWKLQSNTEETFSIDPEAGMVFRNGMELAVNPLSYRRDRIFEEWELSDEIIIPEKQYEMISSEAEIISPQTGKFSGSIAALAGGFYSGKRISIEPEINWRISRHFNIIAGYEFGYIDFSSSDVIPGNEIYKVNLVSLGISYLLSTKFSVKLLSEYEDESDEVGSNLRIRYNPREGTDLYIVFNQGLNTLPGKESPRLPDVASQAFIVKFVRTFGF